MRFGSQCFAQRRFLRAHGDSRFPKHYEFRDRPGERFGDNRESLNRSVFSERFHPVVDRAGLPVQSTPVDPYRGMTFDIEIVKNAVIASTADKSGGGHVHKKVSDDIGRRELIVEINADTPFLFKSLDIVKIIILDHVPRSIQVRPV